MTFKTKLMPKIAINKFNRIFFCNLFSTIHTYIHLPQNAGYPTYLYLFFFKSGKVVGGLLRFPILGFSSAVLLSSAINKTDRGPINHNPRIPPAHCLLEFPRNWWSPFNCICHQINSSQPASYTPHTSTRTAAPTTEPEPICKLNKFRCGLASFERNNWKVGQTQTARQRLPHKFAR